MISKQLVRSAGRGLVCSAGLAAGAYATYAATTWMRYGHVRPGAVDDHDALLDQFLRTYEVVDRHHLEVAAPAAITFAAACGVDFQQSVLIRAIFKGREVLLGSDPDVSTCPRGLVALTTSLGWGVLAEVPGREVVVGAVTQPWKPNVVFRALPPDSFAAFNEPDYVKIVWTLRADPIDAGHSIVRTETRAATTDPAAREKFRRYWSVVSPGIVMIRRVGLPLVRSEAERRARENVAAPEARKILTGA
jgi:hypothetical protein